MSDRGSFVTEYVYCGKCFEAIKKYLLGNEKYLCSTTIPSWCKSTEEPELPIIAGKFGGSYSGEELINFKYNIIPKIEKVICHKLRVAVLAEEGEEIFIVVPCAV